LETQKLCKVLRQRSQPEWPHQS